MFYFLLIRTDFLLAQSGTAFLTHTLLLLWCRAWDMGLSAQDPGPAPSSSGLFTTHPGSRARPLLQRALHLSLCPGSGNRPLLQPSLLCLCSDRPHACTLQPKGSSCAASDLLCPDLTRPDLTRPGTLSKWRHNDAFYLSKPLDLLQ
uniref:Uncharacterized protein n=1 Tax=Knipowitschia caucasica TaxID=637954 RepID=A0AAV2LTP2_KNICA